MRAVALRVGASLRRGWKATLVVAAVVAVVVGMVLGLAAGARRTATAPDRYTAFVGGDLDAVVVQPLERPRLDELNALPAVAEVQSLTFAGLRIGGREEPNPFVGSGPSPAAHLVDGRRADPAHPEEFVANLAFVELYGAKVGDHLPVESWTQDQVTANHFEEAPGGPSFEAVLVGVTDGPDDLDDPTPSAVFPLSLLDGNDIGVVTTLFAVELVPGASRDDLRAQLDALPGGSEFSVDSLTVVSGTVRNAVAAQAQGLWVIALVAAVAGIATLGQVLSRHSRVPEVDRRKLVALGAGPAHVVGEAVGRALVPAAAGMVAGCALAVLASPFFPIGFVRRVEPGPGLDVDAYLLVGAGVLLLVGLLAWVAVAAWFGQRRPTTEQPSALVEAVATHAGTAPAAAGLRFAFVRNEREAGSVAATLIGLTVAIVGLVAASVFAVSIGRLVSDGGRFGNNFDLLLGNGWLPARTDLRAALGDDADIEGLMLLGAGTARSGPATIELVAVDPVRGGLTPRLLTGRMPGSADEIALGRETAGRLGLSVGDDLTLEGDGTEATFRVVGLAVVPALGVNTGVGVGAILNFDGVHDVAPDVTKGVAAVVLRTGAPSATPQRLGELTYTPPGVGMTPAAILNVGRIDRVPVVLAALLAALATVLLANALVQSVRARRRDHAILRALGADRRCIGRAVHWQATALVVLPLVLGLPVGIVLGRLVYAAFVDRIGAVPDPSTPLLLVVAVVVGWLVLANVIGVLPARRARNVAPALLLRSE